MHRIIWLGSIALLSSPLTAWSQEPGSRVRITELNGTRRHSGTLVTTGADSVLLRLDRDGETVAFPVAGLSRFEVSRGRKGHTLTGAAIGFLVGAGLGALVGYSECGSGCTGEENLGGLSALAGAGIGGGIGLIVGAVAGSAWKTDRWEAIPLGALRVSAWPTGPGRFGLALSLQF